MSTELPIKVLRFIRSLYLDSCGCYRSVPDGPITLYGTCYALLTRHYLGEKIVTSETLREFFLNSQDPETGLVVGPELRDLKANPGSIHSKEHLELHLTCAALPIIQHLGLRLRHPLYAAHNFCELAFLRSWLDQRDLSNAWFEGNNILFVGQLLIYLRDVEEKHDAQNALNAWFDWLDAHVDPQTSLWGTNGYCSADKAVYGGYHQLLVYYHENHRLTNPRGLVDTVLSLQHDDGGFNPKGNGGACEDVDSVDILVNLYKRFDYRRPAIRVALRRCFRHIVETQNKDGGFPYNRSCMQSHMGIPGTFAASNVSTMFATWFRVHTMALLAEILTDEPELNIPFHFTKSFSMGWHYNWDKNANQLTPYDRKAEYPIEIGLKCLHTLHTIKLIWGENIRPIAVHIKKRFK